MPNFEDQLAELDHRIEVFARLVEDYPANPPYAESLSKLRRERSELANTIGK